MFKDILEKIKEYQTITLFRHENPDGDAAGSQLALREWIVDNFASKEVYVLGTKTYDIYPYVDCVCDEKIEGSLAIVLDCANTSRIDDKRYSLAKEIIKIDHHPDIDAYGMPRYVDEKASSVCQIITEMLFSFEEYKISAKTCEFLYSGLLTDSLCFRTSNTTKQTFGAASKLISKNINPSVIYERVFSIDYSKFRSANYVRNNHILDDGLAYVLVDKVTQNEFNLESNDFRNRVAEFGGVKEIKIWAIFTEEENGTWRGSLRSRGIIINKIAEQFDGGGHSNACGVTLSCKDEIYLLINSLKKLIIE